MKPRAQFGKSRRGNVRPAPFRLASVVLLSVVAAGGVLADDDVVVVANGDSFRGEIMSLDRGLLRFKMDATNTISLFWTHVRALTSTQSFQVTLDTGQQLFGTLVEADNPTSLRISTATGEFDLQLASVVRMAPIEGRLLDRIDMDISLGYNLTKANNVTQTTLGYGLNYRSEVRLISLAIDARKSSSGDGQASQRDNSSLSYRRFVVDRLWDPVGFGAIERNDELGLDRRATLGGGMARWLTDTNSNRISFMGGLVGTRERETDALESEDSVEAAVGLNLDWFRYEDPELDVSMLLAIYERLSGGDQRTRGNLDVNLRWELVSDFFWGFSVYYSFNTRPTGEAAKQDYGIVTTLGWQF